MDEATSALDGVTEDAVIQAIRELSTRKTIILVAHRLTTVRECDAIFLFEDGEVVTTGTYQELFSTNLKFRAMASGNVEGIAAS
jgi:ABC-type multidrug transport system fused ATPase/permease subunit